jgi:hypothetical protein
VQKRVFLSRVRGLEVHTSEYFHYICLILTDFWLEKVDLKKKTNTLCSILAPQHMPPVWVHSMILTLINQRSNLSNSFPLLHKVRPSQHHNCVSEHEEVSCDKERHVEQYGARRDVGKAALEERGNMR